MYTCWSTRLRESARRRGTRVCTGRPTAAPMRGAPHRRCAPNARRRLADPCPRSHPLPRPQSAAPRRDHPRARSSPGGASRPCSAARLPFPTRRQSLPGAPCVARSQPLPGAPRVARPPSRRGTARGTTDAQLRCSPPSRWPNASNSFPMFRLKLSFYPPECEPGSKSRRRPSPRRGRRTARRSRLEPPPQSIGGPFTSLSRRLPVPPA